MLARSPVRSAAAPSGPIHRIRATNSTDSAFTAPVATTTQPSGEGVLDYTVAPPAWLAVYPFGTGSDGNQFDVRVIGWRLVDTLWIPAILVQFTATLSTFVGLAGADVLDTERFADTVSAPAANLGNADVNCVAYSPQNNTPGLYVLDAIGCTVFRVDFARSTASAANALVGPA